MTRLGVIGAGTMGGGIAQVGAQQGMDVVLCDVTDEFLANGVGRIRASLQRNVERGRISADEADATAGRITTTTDFAAMADADCVIEAVIEEIETKRRVFRALDDNVKDGAVLATNTSSLSVTEIAAATQRPEWVVGMHFFNPVPAMALVEVARGHSTSPKRRWSGRSRVARELGKTPVRCEDTPGFIVNRIVRPFYNEALRILQRAHRLARGHRPDHEGLRLPHGALRADGPHRQRRELRRHLLDLRGAVPGAAASARRFCSNGWCRAATWARRRGGGGTTTQLELRAWRRRHGGSIEPGGDGGARPVTIVGSDAWAEELAGALSSLGREVRVVSPYLEPREDLAEELAEATKGVALALDVNRFSIYTDDLDDHLGAEGVIGCLTLTSSTSFRSSESEDRGPDLRVCGYLATPHRRPAYSKCAPGLADEDKSGDRYGRPRPGAGKGSRWSWAMRQASSGRGSSLSSLMRPRKL